MKLLHRLDLLISKVEGAVLIVFLSAMVLMSFLQVVLRNAFDTGIVWGDVMLRYLVFFIGLLAASLATRDEKHINIDVLAKVLPPRLKSIAGILTNLFAGAVTYFLLRASLDFIDIGLNPGDTMFLGIPVVGAGYVIIGCFGLMTFRFALRAIDRIIETVTGKAGEEGAR